MPGSLTTPRTRPLEPADARIVDTALVEIAARLNAMAGGPVVVWRSRPVARAALPPLLQGLAVSAPAVLVEQEVGDPSPVVPSGQMPTPIHPSGVLQFGYAAAERVPAPPWSSALTDANLAALRDQLNRLLTRLRFGGFLEVLVTQTLASTLAGDSGGVTALTQSLASLTSALVGDDNRLAVLTQSRVSLATTLADDASLLTAELVP